MKDFLQECMSEDRGLDAKSFQEIFCAHCRNSNCTLARWGMDKFAQRVSTQENRLLKPQQLDPSLYPNLPPNFLDMLQTALRLEIADKRGDWEIPEILILDGHPEMAAQTITDAVDDAARVLAKSKGTELSLPEPQSEDVVPVSPPQKDTPTPPQPLPQESFPKTSNTSWPSEGIIVGGGRAPASRTSPVTVDPWEPPAKQAPKVEPGARIRLGSGEKK